MHFNLVFEGGGAKGVVFAGAMQEFEKQGHTYGRLLGTSAGAITATLLAAGFSPQEMLVQVNEKLPDGSPRFGTFMDIAESITDEDWENSVLFKLFNQINWPFVPESAERKMDDFIFKQFMQMKIYRLLFTFLELGGLYAGRAFLTWLREKLDLNGRNLGQATLAQFYEHTGKDLNMVASNITDGGVLVFGLVEGEARGELVVEPLGRGERRRRLGHPLGGHLHQRLRPRRGSVPRQLFHQPAPLSAELCHRPAGPGHRLRAGADHSRLGLCLSAGCAGRLSHHQRPARPDDGS